MLVGLTCLLIVLFAAATVFFRKPMNSVLSLILAFFATAGLMIQTGLEALGLILIIVYVGAVAILFIFMLMMFPHARADDRNECTLHLSICGALCVLLTYVIIQIPHVDILNIVTFDVTELAIALYQKYHIGVLLMGGVLFVSMLVIIGLTLPRDYSRREAPYTQHPRVAKLPRRVRIASKSKGNQ